MNDWLDQPLGYVEPDYDNIDGLAWAWCGGGNHVETVIAGMSPKQGRYFSGWASDGASSSTSLIFAPDRAVPMTTANDFTLEYIGRMGTRSVNSLPCCFLALGPSDLSTQSIGIGLVGNSGGYGFTTTTSGFQNYNSGLAGGTNLHHFIVTRYRSRMYAWMHIYETGVVTRHVDGAPPSNVMAFTVAPHVVLMKPNSASATFNGEIFKAAVYTRGMPEAEAEALLRDPWGTFLPARPRQRLTTILTSAAPGGFNPAWAAGANRYIGGGIHV